MRNFAFVLLNLFVLSALAQIPNGNFENWGNRSLDEIATWNSAGNVSKTADAVAGDYAIRLENDVTTGLFGAVTNAELEENLPGGDPYTDIPLLMSFSTKFDLGPGDEAQIRAIFKLDGLPIGQVDFTMTGNTGDTFQRINYPIQWVTQIAPDSLIVVISSVDLENPTFSNNGYVIVDSIVFNTFGTPKTQLGNSSFEDWTAFTIEHPTSWYTTDLLVLDQFSQAINLSSVTKPAHVQSGSNAITLKNITLTDEILPGAAMTGTGLGDIEKPTFPVNRRWAYFQGLYKYQPDNGDVGTVAALFYKGGTLMGGAQLTLTDSTRMDEYTYFSTAIQYFGADIPDSATVVLTSADLENAAGTSSQLWVDNISFTDHTASVPKLNRHFKLYPNPANDKLQLLGFDGEIVVRVINPLGQSVLIGTKPAIDISSLPPGQYSVQVVMDNKALFNSRFVKL